MLRPNQFHASGGMALATREVALPGAVSGAATSLFSRLGELAHASGLDALGCLRDHRASRGRPARTVHPYPGQPSRRALSQ